GELGEGMADAPSVVLLVEDHTGYTNLCRLLTRSHAGLPKGEAILEIEALAEHQKGLVAIVPGPCYPGAAGAPEAALLETLAEAFGPERAFVAAFRRMD